MKKAAKVIIWATVIWLLFLSVTRIAGIIAKYEIYIKTDWAVAVVGAALALGTVIATEIARKEPFPVFYRVLLILTVPVSIVSTFPLISQRGNIAATFGAVATVICCLFAAIRVGLPPKFGVPASLISLLIVIPLCIYAFFTVMLKNFGETTVVDTFESTDGTYYAELISDSEGALGGSTRVKVYKNNDIDFLILEIRKPKKDIYVGNWGALSRVEMHWQTDDVLIINNVEYDMKAE